MVQRLPVYPHPPHWHSCPLINTPHQRVQFLQLMNPHWHSIITQIHRSHHSSLWALHHIVATLLLTWPSESLPQQAQSSNPFSACWFSSISGPKGQVAISVSSSVGFLSHIWKKRSHFGNRDSQTSGAQAVRLGTKCCSWIFRENGDRGHYWFFPFGPRTMPSTHGGKGIIYYTQCDNWVFNWPYYCYLRPASLGWWNAYQFSSVPSFSRVWLFAIPWTVARQASLSITNSWSMLKLTSIE